MIRSLAFMLLASLLAACSSTGVVPTGGDTYMSAKSGGTVTDMTADLYREASAFCASQDKKIEKINLTEQSRIPFVRQSSSKLEFRCV